MVPLSNGAYKFVRGGRLSEIRARLLEPDSDNSSLARDVVAGSVMDLHNAEKLIAILLPRIKVC